MGSTKNAPILMNNPGAVIGFIVGFTSLVLILGFTTYMLLRRRRRFRCGNLGDSTDDVRRTLKLGKDQLLDEPHSYTHSWSGSSGIVEGSNSSRHLPSPDKTSVTENGFVTSGNKSNFMNNITSGLGKLQFTAAYDSNLQELHVSILRCLDIPQADTTLNTVDSYIKLELLPEKRHRVKTRVVRGSSSPFFGEAFTMNKIGMGALKSGSLHFIVVGFDRHSRDSVIGEVVCPLEDMNLHLSKEVTLTRDILRRKLTPSDKNRGMLLISLCYLPAASRITAVILKAEGLPTVDLADSAGNPYVKVYFMENDKRIAKKKTHVKKRTSNPVFNEAFALDVPQNAKLENIKLDFRLVNWERDSPSKVVGHVIIGCNGNEKAKHHWNTAIENPRKQVAEWHKLTA